MGVISDQSEKEELLKRFAIAVHNEEIREQNIALSMIINNNFVDSFIILNTD